MNSEDHHRIRLNFFETFESVSRTMALLFFHKIDMQRIPIANVQFVLPPISSTYTQPAWFDARLTW